MTPKVFVSHLAAVRLQNVFNPYGETCSEQDQPDGAERRQHNLTLFLEAALDARVETVWIARDLGYRGGRRTGVPLTDEVHLPKMTAMFDDLTLERATTGPAVAERTAAVVWSALLELDQPVFLWNVFPLHPHEAGDRQTNRTHTRAERALFTPLLLALLAMLQPKTVVAIGRDAQLALAELEIHSCPVRHPSYGGQAEFLAGLSALYGRSLASPSPATRLL